MKIYSEKKTSYFTNPRLDLISLIPNNSQNKILEIGAGGGDTLVKIKELNLASEVTGIELFDMPETNQNHPAIDQLIICNIETSMPVLPNNYYDIILCGDVLEHLIDPWAIVKHLSSLLKKGGLLIVSVPNIREFKTLYKIVVKGDFRYEESGILDKTHLKFFCRKNIIELMQGGGFQVVKVTTNLDYPTVKTKKHVFNDITLKVFEDFLALQYIVVSHKKGE
jgi:2-polyprenyl-3-methyl-5-hydroxy-6-metoxy-1,4-benzoquinol methylase